MLVETLRQRAVWSRGRTPPPAPAPAPSLLCETRATAATGGRQQPPPPAGAPIRSVRFAELELLPGPPVTPAAVPVPPGGRRVPGPFQPPSGRELTPQGESSHPRASAVSSLQVGFGFLFVARPPRRVLGHIRRAADAGRTVTPSAFSLV